MAHEFPISTGFLLDVWPIILAFCDLRLLRIVWREEFSCQPIYASWEMVL